MFGCIHDPGLALFLAEGQGDDPAPPGPLEWMALSATILIALAALVVPA